MNLGPSEWYGIEGLSESEVIARRERGQANTVQFQTGRTYLQILRKNAFTFINTILFAISVILVLMGHLDDALVTAGLVLLNVVVGVVQEGRAKRKLEHIALLTRPRASVIRDGHEREVDPSEVVVGDALIARPGDQVVVDGQVIAGREMQLDESLLTGESERVRKGPGDTVLSGSFCVSGSGVYEAQKVGEDSLVNQLTAGARAFRQVKTPLQRDVDSIIRALVFVVTPLGVLLGISYAVRGIPLVESVRAGAVIVALIPQGLFFMTTVAYAMGILRVAGEGALIQEANAVESISNVDLLCFDKTGTLTTNRIKLHAMRRVDGAGVAGEAELKGILGDYAASTLSPNRTTLAIKEAFVGRARRVSEEVPFSSEHRWSALAFDDPSLHGVYVLGAPDVLRSYLQSDPGMDMQLDEWTSQGLRALLFAYRPVSAPLYDDGRNPALPSGLLPLSLLSFSDELRPEARETLSRFADLGIELKVISGDNPATVQALARQVGLSDNRPVVSGLELDGLNDTQVEELAREATIFGRITPQQKERLVRLFRRMRYYVAMIGDGVNDVLPLKQAQVGVAMQSGSQAARSVSDIVLLGDSFGALPIAFREGQRIINGMQDVVRLLLTRTLYVMVLILITQLAGLPFPVTPKHNSILALLTVGIPIFSIAAWARPGPSPRSVIRTASHFVLPAALTIAVVAVAVYLSYLGATGDVDVARTALTTVTVACGVVLIPFVEPPTRAWVGGDVLSGDWRPTALALGMLAAYAVVLALPPLRSFFELTILRPFDYLLMASVVTLWAFLLRFIWRTWRFELALGQNAS